MSGWQRALVAVCLASSAAAGRGQPAAMVELHHRSADALITALRPLVAPATLSGAGMQLQVRTAAPSDLGRVVRLVQEADQPPRPLRVTLSDAPETAARPPQPSQPHGSVSLSTGGPLPADPYGNGQVLSTHGGAQQQPVDILEGDPLSLSMPAPQSLWFGVNGNRGAGGAGRAGAAGRAAGGGSGAAGAGGGPPGAAGVVHFDSMTDFTARIWLAGSAVAIDLQPRAAGRVGAGAEENPAHATVYGQVGQWIALVEPGTELPSPHMSGSGAAGAGLWIKVETVPQPPGAQ